MSLALGNVLQHHPHNKSWWESKTETLGQGVVHLADIPAQSAHSSTTASAVPRVKGELSGYTLARRPNHVRRCRDANKSISKPPYNLHNWSKAVRARRAYSAASGCDRSWVSLLSAKHTPRKSRVNSFSNSFWTAASTTAGSCWGTWCP